MRDAILTLIVIALMVAMYMWGMANDPAPIHWEGYDAAITQEDQP